MSRLRSGRAAVEPEVQALAEVILERHTGEVAVLTGITLLAAEAGRPAARLDLVIVSERAIVVGVDANRPAEERVAPRTAGRRVVRLQQTAGAESALRVYVCWLGEAAPQDEIDPSPALGDGEALWQFLRQAERQNPPAGPEAVAQTSELLLRADSGRVVSGPPTPALRRALRLFEELNPLERGGRRPAFILPADVRKRLRAAMLDRSGHLEDVNYGKIVPNEYVVELNEENYERHYRPIAGDLSDQWRRRLLDDLNTANSRQGRKEFRFGGPVRVRLQPVAGLAESEVNVIARVQGDAPPVPAPAGETSRACLAQYPGGERYPLRDGTTVLGRSRRAGISVDSPQVQEMRLISGRHAHIICERGECRLYDGSPDGKPSLNGTFLNGRAVPAGGMRLQEGDQIILAALDPERPRPDTPGVVTFTFHANC